MLAKKWKEDIDKNVFLQDGTSVPVVLVGNKADLLQPKERENILQRLKAAQEEWGFKASFVSSAYSGIYVEDLFTEIGSLAMNGMPRMFAPATDSIRLTHAKKEEKQCCLN
jgi:GTPase Era involved in 16S rRNA processing